jgi:signal peptidase
MRWRTIGKRILGGIGAFFLFLTIVGVVLGQPLGLVFVETGSMSPTIDTGDAYIAVPTAVAGPPSTGDIVAFKATVLNGGGLVTHRIVDQTQQGYITRGDANPFTDQDGGEPPVQPQQIKAKALSIGGVVITIPYVGVLVTGISGFIAGIQRQLAALLGTRALLGPQGLAYLLLGFGGLTYIIAAWTERSTGRQRKRKASRRTGLVNAHTIISVMTVLLVVLVTVSMVLPAGVHQFQFVSSEADSQSPSVIKVGTSENLTFNVPSNGFVPVVTVFETGDDGVRTNQSTVVVSSGETRQITVTLDAPSETGVYTRRVQEHRYPAILPSGLILSLYRVHSWLPLIITNTIIGGSFAILSLLLLGLDPIRIDHRQDNASLAVRIKRRLR